MKGQITFKQSLQRNLVALISLVVAITALCYTAWREERTEKNRTLRVASFEVLKNLGELQVVVNASYYQKDNPLGSSKSDPMLGWGYIALIGDLSALLPEPTPSTVDNLVTVWKSDWNSLKTDHEAVDRVSHEIDASRLAVGALLQTLK